MIKKKVSQPNKILFQFPSKERKSHLKQLKNKGISKQETFYFSFCGKRENLDEKCQAKKVSY